MANQGNTTNPRESKGRRHSDPVPAKAKAWSAPESAGQQGGDSHRPPNMPRVKHKTPKVFDEKLASEMVKSVKVWKMTPAASEKKPPHSGPLYNSPARHAAQFGERTQGKPPGGRIK